MIHADRVRWDAEARHVRLKSRRRFVTDAPFAETKGLLGRFYVIGRAAKDEAIEWAKKIPLRERPHRRSSGGLAMRDGPEARLAS